MTTITWKGGSASWSSSTSWFGFVVPGQADTAVFVATDSSVATIDQDVAVAGVSVASGSHVTLTLQDTLAVGGTFSLHGGTLNFGPAGVLVGGTVDLTGGTVFTGGLIEDSVLTGNLGYGVTVDASALAATEAARGGNAALTVVGTLSLADGTYSGDVISLHPSNGSAPAELDAVSNAVVVLDTTTRVTLSQDDPGHTPGIGPGGPQPTLGGLGAFDNLGMIVSDAISANISSTQFFNDGTLDLYPSTIVGQSASFLGGQILTWTGDVAPSLAISSSDFENNQTILGTGAVITVSGSTFFNGGLISLGTDATQGVIQHPTPEIGTVVLQSTLDIAASVTDFSNVGGAAAGTISASLIQFDGSVDLASLGILQGAVLFSGTLDLGGGTLDTSTLPAGTTYKVTGTIENGTVLDTGHRIDLSRATESGVQVLLSPSTTLTDIGSGLVVLGGTTTELAYTSPRSITSIEIEGGAAGITDTVALTGSLTLGSATSLSDAIAQTTLEVLGGTLVENGRIDVTGSTVRIATLDGHGTIDISNGGELDIGAIASTANLTIDFGVGVSELVLPPDASGIGHIGLTLLGLHAGDLIDFRAVSDNSGTVFAQPGGSVTGGLLQAQGASGDQATVKTPQPHLVFTATGDSSGGTLLTVGGPACFRQGTRIMTPRGERPVQELRMGDLVTTYGNSAQEIKWIGRRSYTAQALAEHPQLRPVRIAAGALARNLPNRTLYLSPLHALLVDEVLVPVGTLVNGRTIGRARPAALTYFHVELDRPDIIVANGMPSETFVDCDSRKLFDNADEFARLYPADLSRRATFPVERIEEGWRLEAIRSRLPGNARPPRAPGALRGHIDRVTDGVVEGWVCDASEPNEALEFELVVEGWQVACLVANRYRLDLDHAGIGRAAHGFTARLPALSGAAISSLHLARLSDGARLNL